MKRTADIEFSIHRQDWNSYAIDFNYTDSNAISPTNVQSDGRHQTTVSFNFNKLKTHFLIGEHEEYGKELTASFFSDESLRTDFAQACTAAKQNEEYLRIRLSIGANAKELHSLKWELLNDPFSGRSLITDHTILFSRYIFSQDWRPVHLRSRNKSKILAVIASPSGLDKDKFTTIDKSAEIATITAGLEGFRLKILEHATLAELVTAFTREDFDILYLVAHGMFRNEEGCLLLENEQNGVMPVTSTELVTRLSELEHRPHLIVMISCQSAGRGTGDVLSALGSRLTEAGIPVVLAMQGNLRMDTAAKFTPVFFCELLKDGQIDRALSVARGQIRRQPDWWAPTLFMRMKSGQMWYTPGFADPQIKIDTLPAQIENIKEEHFTPVLGPGLVEYLFGSYEQIARTWAEAYHYPLAAHERESFPQVVQYLAVSQQQRFPYQNMMRHLRKRLQVSFGESLSSELMDESTPSRKILEGVGLVGRLLRENNPDEPHRALAELPVAVFLTANADTLLEDALKDAGKKPQTRFSPWNKDTCDIEATYKDDTYSKERPLVYHLLGLWTEPSSLVLTEDNYLDFLLGISLNKALIPKQAKMAMAGHSLLFLGFQTNEWQFRVLFRTMLSLPGRRDLYTNVAVQMVPEDGRMIDPQGARKYLEQYFSKGCKFDLSIYWGTAEEYIKEMMQYWRRQG